MQLSAKLGWRVLFRTDAETLKGCDKMGGLSEELKALLHKEGAALVGFGDLRGVSGADYPCGVSVAINVPAHILEGIEDGPTTAYYEMYHELNARLNQIVSAGADFLEARGFKAFAQTTKAVRQDDSWATPLPHKTVATRAGLGWIGKNCLLVTPEYGSAVRLSSLLTDAPLSCGAAVNESRCGGCRVCQEACPAGALTGALWQVGVGRDEMFQKEKCREKQIELMKARTGIETDLCGKCFVVCPYARRYVRRAKGLSAAQQ